MNDYKATIGLEVHAELKTRTKMFCDSRNDPEEKQPNVNICPVCLAHPGTLPVVNQEAVKHVLKVGLALGGQIADFTEFDRKNYFYPDIPKGYQISQYKFPLVTGGSLNGVAITRVHLEEDTARSTHDRGYYTLIDFNRAGIPLMELVTEPVIKTAEEASAFARELQLLLRYLGAGDANMEKGEMRVEANVSVSKTDEYGVKVEVKNLNSFKVVEKAIAYEIKRQIEELESGGRVAQETRGWDEDKQSTFSQREKESSHDYRYFPDPDLPKLKLSEIPELSEAVLRKEIPELPWEKRKRYLELGIKAEDVEVYISDQLLEKFLNSATDEFSGDEKLIILASNYIISDVSGLVTKNAGKSISAVNFPKLIRMVAEGKISSRGAKDVLPALIFEGGDPERIVAERGLLQQSDEEVLNDIAGEVIGENGEVVAEYKSGKENSLQYLVGQGMKKSKGSANPQILKDIFIKLLE